MLRRKNTLFEKKSKENIRFCHLGKKNYIYDNVNSILIIY